MLRDKSSTDLSEFLLYLSNQPENDSLPSLAEISDELGMSVAALREQLEVARALGLVEVRPRTGTRRLPFSFGPAVRQIVKYAVALDHKHFEQFSQLRNHLEAAYIEEAARLLDENDKKGLRYLCTYAQELLHENPVQVPHDEHRQFHIWIYHRLNNPFVTGILQAYWDAYEEVGMNLYAGSLDYLEEVWRYHALIADNIIKGDYTAARDALVKHVDLLAQRPG
jgi:DNA-binding FadR family transcriptional regulator